MAFSEPIQAALAVYDQTKGRFRKLFYLDHPAIRALRRLAAADQNDLSKLYNCFIENLPNSSQASYGVFKAFLETYGVDEDLLDTLSKLGVLTAANIDLVKVCASPAGVVSALRALSKTYYRWDYLNTRKIFYRLLHHDNSFLCSEASVEIIWRRLPESSLTPTIFNQLIEYAQVENPEQKIRQYVDTLLPRNESVPAVVINDNQNVQATRAFPESIQVALQDYDQKKGFLRKLFSFDHPAIRALRKLPAHHRNDLSKIYQCFADNLPRKYQQSYQVYLVVLDKMAFPMPVKIALKLYDEKNYPLKDGPVISALRKLPEADKNNLFKLCKCFIENNHYDDMTDAEKVVWKAVVALLSNRQPSILNLNSDKQTYLALFRLNRANILTSENFDALLSSVNFEACVRALLSLDQANLLTSENFDALLSSVNFEAFSRALPSLNRVNLLTQGNRDVVKVSTKPEACANTLRTLDEVDLLTERSRKACAKPNSCFIEVIGRLYEAGLLTKTNLNRLIDSSFLCSELANINIWSRLPRHLLTQTVFEQLLIRSAHPQAPGQQIRQYVDGLLGRGEAMPVINNNQSTHTASVHNSISDSATRLLTRYKDKIGAEIELVNKLKEIKLFIEKLPSDNSKNEAAKRCIARIAAPNCNFSDPVSQVTTHQLLALTFVAIHDVENRVGDLQDAETQFIEGLYEIQRGYNLSATGIDDGLADKPICTAGTFNKLVEKLQGIHPDCEIRFITSQTVSLKLPIVAREEAVGYLTELVNPLTAEEYISYKNLTDQIKTDGIEVILDKIQDRIAGRIFEEFGSLYKSRSDNALTSLVDTAKYISLSEKDLNCLREKVQNSPGYNQFCNKNLMSATIFFSSSDSSQSQADNVQPSVSPCLRPMK